jgi:hypothetical protein
MLTSIGNIVSIIKFLFRLATSFMPFRAEL